MTDRPSCVHRLTYTEASASQSTLSAIALGRWLVLMPDDVVLDRMYHALADSSRRTIVERLSRGPASVSELARPLAMSLAAVVQHVQVLEASGLIRSEKVGRVRTCRIESTALAGAERWIAERRSGWEQRLDRLDDLLAEPDGDTRRGG